MAEGFFINTERLKTYQAHSSPVSMGNLALAAPNYLSEHEQQKRYDLTTLFAEQVEGNIRTDFELKFTGYDLIGEDGRGMDEITKTALTDAEVMANKHPELSFEKRRRKLEREEFRELVGMANGFGPNTMIVVSDFPAELKAAKEDVGGYSVSRKQTMLRVLSRKKDGNVHMSSINLDGSNRQALEAIYASYGIEPEKGELLGQRIRVELDEAEQESAVDDIRKTYDASMTEQFGGEWYGGRRPADRRNTYEFVLRQHDLIDECIRLDKLGWLNEEFMYGVVARMQERFIKYSEGDVAASIAVTSTELTALHQEIIGAGQRAGAMGKVFSGCGVTMGAKGLKGSVSFKLAGYGNQSFDDEDGDCEFISKECPSCGTENVLTRSTKTDSGRIVSGSCGCSKYYAAA